MRPLAYSITPFTKKIFGKKAPLFGQLITQWHDITAGLGCETCRPTDLKFPRGKNSGATLTVTTSSSHAFTLQHITPQIIARINQFFGYSAIDKVVFSHQSAIATSGKISSYKKPNPDKLRNLEIKLKNITDEEMKKALVALGKSVIHKEEDDS